MHDNLFKILHNVRLHFNFAETIIKTNVIYVNEGSLLHHAERSKAAAALSKIKKLLSYLIAPFQHIFLSLLQLVVDVEKLNNTVLSDVVGILLGFLPVRWRAL